jgi:broad specificity phosphatase PhoE
LAGSLPKGICAVAVRVGGNIAKAFAVVTICIGTATLSISPALANEAALWKALRSGGHVALLRHALAPGTGDPEEFSLGDCGTQRNLSAQGRAQAKFIGLRFRANGIESARVYSSEWCRCRDTAEALELGLVRMLSVLNSFFGRWEKRDPQTRALRGWLTQRDLGQVHILVTHQVNITALTGVFPSSGELVIVRPSRNGDVTVVGTIETSANVGQ